MRLGYANIRRMADGWYGWRDLVSPGSTHPEQIPRLTAGEFFPACNLYLLNHDSDRKYLQVDHDRKQISLEDVPSDYIFIEIYNELCTACVNEVKTYKALYRMFLEDPVLGKSLKMMGIGIGSKKRSVARFRKRHTIDFPLCADEKREIFDCLGQPVLPVAYLVRREGKKRRIRLIHSGHINNAEELMNRIKSVIEED